MMTSETSSGLNPARFRTSLITTEHRSCKGSEDRAPFKDPASGKDYIMRTERRGSTSNG